MGLIVFVNIFPQMLLWIIDKGKYPNNYFSLHACHPRENL